MKIRVVLCSTLLATLAVSCQIPYTPYQGAPALRNGHGGTVRTVDGIDMWEDGEPERKFKILGVLQDDHESDSALASAARKQGGNVLIHGGINRTGDPEPHMRNRWLVALYVE
jgi:hypothetical protein